MISLFNFCSPSVRSSFDFASSKPESRVRWRRSLDEMPSPKMPPPQFTLMLPSACSESEMVLDINSGGLESGLEKSFNMRRGVIALAAAALGRDVRFKRRHPRPLKPVSQGLRGWHGGNKSGNYCLGQFSNGRGPRSRFAVLFRNGLFHAIKIRLHTITAITPRDAAWRVPFL
jgi:hypothetical protein